MNNLTKILDKLSANNMHVHVLDHTAGYKGFNIPIAHLANSTHFIMQGSEIVHVGNIKTIESFALRLA